MFKQRHKLIAILYEMTAGGRFNAVAIDLLKPRNERQQNGLGLLRARTEHEKRRQVLTGGVDGIGELDLVGLRGDRGAHERLGDSVRIDDHDHRTVAEDRRAGKGRDVAQLRGGRLDYNFLGVEYAVDDDAEDLIADLGNDDEAVVAFALAEL